MSFLLIFGCTYSQSFLSSADCTFSTNNSLDWVVKYVMIYSVNPHFCFFFSSFYSYFYSFVMSREWMRESASKRKCSISRCTSQTLVIIKDQSLPKLGTGRSIQISQVAERNQIWDVTCWLSRCALAGSCLWEQSHDPNLDPSNMRCRSSTKLLNCLTKHLPWFCFLTTKLNS